MKDFAKEFLASVVKGMADSVCAVGNNRADAAAGVTAFHDEVRRCAARGGKVIYIGNGGSASIASHMAADLWKNGGVRTLCFSDPSLLTCLANDLGYENVYAAPVADYAQRGDVLVAISSSGRSPNILKAARAGLRRGCALVTLTGFKPDNPLRRLGKINFYVPSSNYGVVETAHSAFCHAVVDHVIAAKKR